MMRFVVYKRDVPVGTFGSMREVAEFLGVRLGTAYWYATPSARRLRPGTVVERVVV